MSTKTKMLGALVAGVAFAGMAHAVPTADYLKQAGASDLYEIKSSQLVMGSTKDAKVKHVAQMMITDHNKSTAMVKAAAMKSGLTPKPPMLSPKQQAMMDKLMAAKGTARDQLYIEQQKMAHPEALALHKDYAATGDKPALKDTAMKIVPVVEKHIGMLESGHAM